MSAPLAGAGREAVQPLSALKSRGRVVSRTFSRAPQASALISSKPSGPSRPRPAARHVALLTPISACLAQQRRAGVVCYAVAESPDVESFLDEPLKEHDGLVRGTLDNGLRYVILPNNTPEGRFEAHLEIHAGSVDEAEHEQGVAHIVEHVTFLGSRKREILLGTGSRSNAYTDFHHTVFHVHAPLRNVNTNSLMMPQVLDCLVQIAFEPEFAEERIAKERKAVLAEAQMMNTIEYRVDCQLLKYLHGDNALGSRFPIGKVDQIKGWDRDTLRDYWRRWYFPANATLYVVGELPGGVAAIEELIDKTFSRVPAALAPAGEGEPEGQRAVRMRHPVRPPVQHQFGCGPLQGQFPVEVSVFKHPLLQHFMLSVFCKLPVQPLKTMADLKWQFITRLVTSVFQFRISSVYAQAEHKFLGVELDISDSGREGCCVGTFTITSDPGDWEGAVRVGMQEIRRLQAHGVTSGELRQYRAALLGDSEQLSRAADCTPSKVNLDYAMECIALAHTFMDPGDGHTAAEEICASITLEEVNAVARSQLAFAAHYGREAEAAAEAAADPEAWPRQGPTRATSVVACIPEFVAAGGEALQGAGMMGGRPGGGGMTTADHVEADYVDVDAIQEDDLRGAAEVPEGAEPFPLTGAEVGALLAACSAGPPPEARANIDVPDDLLAPEELDARVAATQPAWLPVKAGAAPAPLLDEATGVLQMRLSNGVVVNAVATDSEPGAVLLRVCGAGGRATEDGAAGETAACPVGIRTLSEYGGVAGFTREQTELFCISKLINANMDADYENVFVDLHCASGSLEGAFQMLHCLLREPVWEEAALERAKASYLSNHQALPKSLERSTADRIMREMFAGDERLRDPNAAQIEALTLDTVRRVVTAQLAPDNIEVNLTGDFDPEALGELVLRYFGSLPAPEQPAGFDPVPPVPSPPGSAAVNQVWHLRDSDERACAYIAGMGPPRWGEFGSDAPLRAVEGPVTPPELRQPADEADAARMAEERRRHPIHAGVVLSLLTEVINSRLFTTVRDQLGLTYDVSFEFNMFDRLPSTWFVVNVTSTPQKIHAAMSASVEVLRNLHVDRINNRELLRAKRNLLTRHETDLKDNAHVLGLITHLMADTVPLKTCECLRDLETMFKACSVDDCYNALKYIDLSEKEVYTCIGTSGMEQPAIDAMPGSVLPSYAQPGMEMQAGGMEQFFAKLMVAADAMQLMNKGDDASNDAAAK